MTITCIDNQYQQQPVFYTLSNRKKQGRPKNDTQARLLSQYGVDRKHLAASTQSINSDTSLNDAVSGNSEVKRWSTGYHTAHDTNKQSTYRSSSVDMLSRCSVVTDDSRPKSMECMNNGTHHHNGDSPSDGGPQIEEVDSPPPTVPPRVASLRSLQSHTQTTPNNQTTPPTEVSNVIIKVSESHDRQVPPSTTPQSRNPHVYEEIEIGIPSKFNKQEALPKLQDQQSSSDYDHLFPGNKQNHKPAVRRKTSRDKDSTDQKVPTFPLRRNESLPPMALHSPIISRKPTTDNDSISDSEMDEPVSPLPGERGVNEEGVVMRKKSNDSVSDGTDPFADLLLAPPNKSRLRWSQELNPIYDYVKGVKISPKIGYDSLATTPENTIQEEDVSFSIEDSSSICSSDRGSSSDTQFDGGMVLLIPQSAPNTLQRSKRVPHNYDEVVFGNPNRQQDEDDNDLSTDGGRGRSSSGGSRPMSEHFNNQRMEEINIRDKTKTHRSSPVRRLKSTDSPFSVTPQLNKRMLHRRSKTVRASDDSNAPQGSQHARRVADTMRVCTWLLFCWVCLLAFI